MKKTTVLLVLILIAAGFLGLFYYKKNNLRFNKQTQNKIDLADADNNVDLKPWIEVLNSSVFEVNASGTVLRELETGDEVETGSIIKTDAVGLANIYFAEGSVARLDSGTEIKIDEASYNPEDDSLVVKIFLTAGRVWSKILGLTTQDSQWQVDTANSVATVRGTAFGVEYESGKTRIMGSENKVAVRFKHRKLKRILDEGIEIAPNNYIEVDDNIIESIASKKLMASRILRKTAPTTFLNRMWIRRARTADSELNLILKQEYIEAIDSQDSTVAPQTSSTSAIQPTTIDTSETLIISPNEPVNTLTASTDSSSIQKATAP